MELRPFTHDQESDLQQLLQSDPGYFERITGYPPGSSEALSLTVTRPDGFDVTRKHVLGAWRPGWAGRDELVAVVDLLRGYPDAACCYIGLLLVRFEYQGTGLGRETWTAVQDLVAGWPEIDRFRLAVVETNARAAMPFWQALGFTDTGERRPYRYGPVQSSAILLERPVDDKLPMSNMSVLSSRVEGEERER